MKKPVHISPLGTFLENGINNVLVDVPFAVRHGHKHKIGSFLGNRAVCLKVLDKGHIMFQVDKFCVAVAEVPGLEKNKHGRCVWARHHH